MSSEIVKAPSLPDRMEYARALSTASLLPDAYRGKPGNVLLAVEYGHALGIPPMTAIQGIHVIKGKPTLSADLMAALVRRAGHKLRVYVEDGPVAVAELIRSDDEDYTYRCRWDIDRARAADLLDKDNWTHHPAAMLKARAISEVVREGASEVLHGLIYTPEELGAIVDGDGDVVDGEIVEETADPATQEQLAMMHASFGDLGISNRDAGLAYIANVVGHEVESSKHLTKAEASAVIDALQADINTNDTAAADVDEVTTHPEEAAASAETAQQEELPDNGDGASEK